MLKSLLRRVFRIKPKVVDPWDDASSTYIRRFRQHLDVIASALSLSQNQTIQARLNIGKGYAECAELCNQSGYVFAEVWVHGDTCSPYKAIVTNFSLPEALKPLFVLILPLRTEFQTTKKARLPIGYL